MKKKKEGKTFNKKMLMKLKYWKYNIIEFLRFNKLWHIYSIPNFTWFKVRKIFKKPKVKFYKYIDDNQPYIPDFYSGGSQYSILTMSDFDYKIKWGDFRFEWLPFVLIRLRKWNYLWVWCSPTNDNYNYYETILDCLYKYNKDIELTKKNFGWQKKDENGNWVSAWNEDILK